MSSNTDSKQDEAIYVASRASIPERGEMWRGYRDCGVRITSSWIDEDSEGQTYDFGELWLRITNEISDAAALVLYAEPDDFPLKGAFIEAGIALGMGKPVIVCLPGLGVLPRNYRPIGSWIAHPLVTRCDSVDAAIQLARRPAIVDAIHSRASVTTPPDESLTIPDRVALNPTAAARYAGLGSPGDVEYVRVGVIEGDAVRLIAVERQRQISEEGYDAAHDDDDYGHSGGEIAQTAAAYALGGGRVENIDGSRVIDLWPASWGAEGDTIKRKPRIRQLVIAGALIVAEIERLQRRQERQP